MNHYCFACGDIVDVVTEPLLGGSIAYYCKKFRHFIVSVPQR
jgi:predicted  nucleic acid-binding Zn-ribbon protein